MRSWAKVRVVVVVSMLAGSMTAAEARDRSGGRKRLPGPFAQVCDLARRTLELVERAAPRPKLAAELTTLERRAGAAMLLDKKQQEALYDRIRQLRRRIILSHPALDFDRLVINKRTRNLPGHMCDQYLGRHSHPSPGLAIVESWKDEAKAKLLLTDKLPVGATLHPDLSFDAKRVVFGFCDHSERTDSKQRGYALYEATIDGGKVRRITGTRRDPRIGYRGRQTVWIEDFDPCYLPGGKIAFISTRSQQFGRCHGSRYVPSYILYRCDADGSNIEQISFNEANEWDPSVLPDGRLIYCRWDYINRHDTNFQSLWVTRPDGTMTGHYYGNYSVGPCMIAEPRAIGGSHKVVATATDHHGRTSGSIIVIDPLKGADGGEPLLAVTPEIGFPERGAPRGTTMTPRPLSGPDRSSRGRRGRGRAATPYPITEDIFLVSYPHEARNAIYLIDTLGGRELIYYDPRISCFAPMPLRPTDEPPTIPSSVITDVDDDEKIGRFFVQDVYHCTQPIERGSIKAMRVSEIISQPTRSKPRLSAVNNEIIKQILGTAEVEADGSVAFVGPADVPLQFQLLDENGMAIMTMRSLVYARPGEQVGCVGCHEPRHVSPEPVRPAGVGKFRRLTPPAGPRYAGGFSFARTVQPVLDRYCIGCHGLEKTERGVNLLGTISGNYSVSYDSIMRRGMVRIAQRNGETPVSKPKDYFAHAGKLAKMLLAGHRDKAGKPRVKLDRASFQRIVDWLDLNAQFYGDYSFNRAEHRRTDGKGEKALRAEIAKRFGRKIAEQPFAALVNVTLPTESRILKAPLAQRAGGWGQIPRGWPDSNDAGYRRMLQLVEASIRPRDRRDIAGTCGSDGKGCRCGVCWVRQANEQWKQKAGQKVSLLRATEK